MPDGAQCLRLCLFGTSFHGSALEPPLVRILASIRLTILSLVRIDVLDALDCDLPHQKYALWPATWGPVCRVLGSVVPSVRRPLQRNPGFKRDGNKLLLCEGLVPMWYKN